MISLDSVVSWVSDNFVGVIVIILILGFVVYEFIKKREKKQEDKDNQELNKDKVSNQQEDIKETFDSIYFDKDFNNLNFMEDNNLQRLMHDRTILRHDIEQRKKEYEKLRQRYKEIIELERRLKVHIPALQEQERKYTEMIERLQNKIKNS